MHKKIIQVYKNFDQWKNSPPGLGDFIRGSCHLHELLSSVNVDLKLDISQSDFKNHIVQNENMFTQKDMRSITNAAEYFTDHNALINDLNLFLKGDSQTLFICTNFGHWNRLELPAPTKKFMANFFKFSDAVTAYSASHIPVQSYEVLSIRFGDKYYGETDASPEVFLKNQLFNIIERAILPNLKHPLVVTSDSFLMKNELADKYGFLMLPHHSEHGAFNSSSYPVCVDMSLLKNSKFNYHINLWANWWSGFSHYTSLIFSIPSMNFRAPEFICETLN
jgi:hypothetical protein